MCRFEALNTACVKCLSDNDLWIGVKHLNTECEMFQGQGFLGRRETVNPKCGMFHAHGYFGLYEQGQGQGFFGETLNTRVKCFSDKNFRVNVRNWTLSVESFGRGFSGETEHESEMLLGKEFLG